MFEIEGTISLTEDDLEALLEKWSAARLAAALKEIDARIAERKESLQFIEDQIAEKKRKRDGIKFRPTASQQQRRDT